MTVNQVVAAFEALSQEEKLQVIARITAGGGTLRKGISNGPYPDFGDEEGLPDRFAGIPTGPHPRINRLSPMNGTCPSCGKPL